MRTLSILIFITGFEGEIKMAGILQTVMDNFFSAIPEKQFEGFGSEPVAKKEKKTGLGTKPDSVYKDAYEEMEPVKDETSSIDKLAKIFSDIVREENKDPETGTDRASKVSNTVSYTKGVTTVADLESQGHYVDKILRDNARDTSGKLGSNAAPINRKQNHFDVIRRAIEKHDKDTTFQDARPYRSSRGVNALEGPEALGPITGPVRAGEKELTSYEAYKQGLKGNERFGRGLDPNELASPRRTPRSSRDVYALEGPEALGSFMSRPFGRDSGTDRMKDINESPVFKNYKYNLTNSTNTDNDVKNVQGMLTELGYKAGKADNDLGPGTQRAIRKFQAINGLTISKPYLKGTDPAVIKADYLNAETMAMLKASDVPLAFPDPRKKDAKVTVLVDADFDIFKNEVGKIESGNVYTYYQRNTKKIGGFGMHRKGDLFYGGSGDKYMGRYQMGTAALQDSGYNTEKIHGDMTKAQKDAFIKNPALQDAEFKKYTKKNHIHLTKNSQAYRDMTKEEKLGILGYAHNQGATAAEEYLVTGVSGYDAFGTKGTKYTEALRAAFAEQVRTQSTTP